MKYLKNCVKEFNTYKDFNKQDGFKCKCCWKILNHNESNKELCYAL